MIKIRVSRGGGSFCKGHGIASKVTSTLVGTVLEVGPCKLAYYEYHFAIFRHCPLPEHFRQEHTCSLAFAHSLLVTHTCSLAFAHSLLVTHTCSLAFAHSLLVTHTCSLAFAH